MVDSAPTQPKRTKVRRRGHGEGGIWDDVDLDVRELQVRQQQQHSELAPLKRGASRRVLRLRPWLVDMLRTHRVRLMERQLLAGRCPWPWQSGSGTLSVQYRVVARS